MPVKFEDLPIRASEGSSGTAFDALGEAPEGATWANPRNEQHPDIGRVFERTMLKTFADAGPKTMTRELERRGFEARHAGEMRFSVRKPGEKEWRVLDPQGWASPLEPIYDVLDVVPSWLGLGISMAAGAKLGKRAGVPGRLGGAGAGAGLFETGKQKLAGMLGYEVDPEEAAGKIALESGAGVLGEGGAMALGRLAKSPLGQRALMGAGKLYRPLKRGVSRITGLRRQAGTPGTPAAGAREALAREAPEDEMAALAPDFVEAPEARAARQGTLREMAEFLRRQRELEQVSPEPTPGVLAPGTRRGFELSGSTEPRAKAPGEVPATGGVLEEAGQILGRVETPPGEAGRVIERGAAGPLTPEEFARRAAAEAVSRREWQGYPHPSGGPGPARAEIERDILESLRNPGRDVDDLREAIRRGLFDPVPEEQMGPYAAMIKAGVEPQDAQRIISEFDLPGAGRPTGAPEAPPVGLTPPGPPRPPAAPPGGGEPSPLAWRDVGPRAREEWRPVQPRQVGGEPPTVPTTQTPALSGVPFRQNDWIDWLLSGEAFPESLTSRFRAIWEAPQNQTAPLIEDLEREIRRLGGAAGITPEEGLDIARGIIRRRTAARGSVEDVADEIIRRTPPDEPPGPHGGAGGSPILASGEMGGGGAASGGGMPLDEPGIRAGGETMSGPTEWALRRAAAGEGPEGPPRRPLTPGGASGQPGHVPASPQGQLQAWAATRQAAGWPFKMAGSALEAPTRGLKRSIESLFEAIPRASGSRLALRERRQEAVEELRRDAMGLLGQNAPEPLKQTAREVIDMLGRRSLRTSEIKKAGQSLADMLKRYQMATVGGPGLSEALPSLPEGQRFFGLPPTGAPEIELARYATGLGPMPWPSAALATLGATGLAGKSLRWIGVRIMRDPTGAELRKLMQQAPPGIQRRIAPVLQRVSKSPGAFRAGVFALLHDPQIREFLQSLGGDTQEL